MQLEIYARIFDVKFDEKLWTVLDLWEYNTKILFNILEKSNTYWR